MRRTIKLTESDLRYIVEESVNRIMTEARKNRPLKDYADEITAKWRQSPHDEELWDKYKDLDRMERIHSLRNGDYPTASYQGETYTIDDPLPDNVPVYIRYNGASYASNAYPDNGESLRDYIEGRGESMEDVTDWWFG